MARSRRVPDLGQQVHLRRKHPAEQRQVEAPQEGSLLSNPLEHGAPSILVLAVEVNAEVPDRLAKREELQLELADLGHSRS